MNRHVWQIDAIVTDISRNVILVVMLDPSGGFLVKCGIAECGKGEKVVYVTYQSSI